MVYAVCTNNERELWKCAWMLARASSTETTADLGVDSEQLGRARVLRRGLTQRVVAERLQGAADVEPLVDDLTRGGHTIGDQVRNPPWGCSEQVFHHLMAARTYSGQEEDHAAQREAAGVTEVPWRTMMMKNSLVSLHPIQERFIVMK